MDTHKEEKDLVLIVDDSPDSISMLNDVLEKEGMSVLVALDGKQALNIARKMLPDIILLDAIMPNMDGFEVCQQLKQDPEVRSIPVIFMTGLSDSEHVIHGFEAGGIDYVTKPIINAELIARMRVHLTNSRLTLSAQSALDTAGQYVFSVQTTGQMLWSTPQVSQLLDIANNNSQWLTQTLPLEIKQWLSHQPSIGMETPLQSPSRNLKVALLSHAGNDEVLLRLIDQDSPSEVCSLQDHFQLTQREAEVLLWIAKGKTNREIGQILGTSPRTINKHSENLYNKLGVENRTTAAAQALSYLAQ